MSIDYINVILLRLCYVLIHSDIDITIYQLMLTAETHIGYLV